MKKILCTLCIVFLVFLAPVSATDDCEFIVNARTATEFIDNFDLLNAQLQECPLKLPRSASWLLGNGQTIITIDREEPFIFAITQEQRTITRVEQNPADESCTQRIHISEPMVDDILADDNRAQSVARAYQEGFDIEGCTPIRRAATAVMTRVISFFI